MKNKYGLHARPAALLVQVACKYRSNIELAKDGMVVNAKSILGVMTLAAEFGSEIEIIASGEDAEAAIEDIQKIIENRFEEE
ncbi:MAG: HPr family phosphocarrier protein [Nitrosopumilaceae archaeon]|nr:HPr family phosphocarrier protein [Nitrosopumilaceae archaeon]NIU88651.1 HPr family phosphocarrier protein [Nitrosopumilaceae archaeon]NIV66798.1 HPr family phosphocarrier protein [Nitrosopumilaceae archaeon]NIX62780.1 HPr family phosphocarrier protein [Nitrosopumilaceae archaeon]